ncbi:hypothetical protein Lser_V15G14927 [Lactuca serriola]
MNDINVDAGLSSSETNLKELVDVFCFTGLSNVNSAVWFIYGRKYQFLYIGNLYLFGCFWFIMRLYSLPLTTLLEFLFVVLQKIYVTSNINLVPLPMFILGAVFIIIGVTGISVIYVWKHGKIFVSDDEDEMMFKEILHFLCIILVNGYTMLCKGFLKEANYVWQISGVMLIGVLGFLAIICCILRLIGRWKEYRRSHVRVVATNEVASS